MPKKGTKKIIATAQKNTANNASWNSYPSNLQVLGQPRKGKFRTKRLSSKQKRQLARAATQKQRNKAMRQAREMKSAEQRLENAELVNQVINNGNNAYSLTTEEWYNELARREAEEEAEYERLEREYEIEQIRKAEEKMKKAPKNTVTVRINDTNTNRIANFLSYLALRKPHKFEILYLDEDPAKSYYYIFKFDDNRDSNNNNDYIYHYRRYQRREYNPFYNPFYNVFSKPPADYFRPVFIPHYYNFYGPNENDDFDTYGANFLRRVYTRDIFEYIRGLPNIKRIIKEEKEAKARREAAKATAPAKLKELQLKGLEGWIQEMEERTGKTMPRNVQNVIERSIRPFDYRYYQGRDNLQRIQTDLFQ